MTPTTSAAITPEAVDTSGRIAELDGFRAIAVWLVVLCHIFFAWPFAPGALKGIPGPILWVLGRGWLGVDLFFVLSGFLITGILLDSRDKPHYYRNFYGRRALRILPLCVVVIAISALFYRDAWRYFLLALFFMANFAIYFGVPVPHGPSVFWSLSVEEHFYLGWPLAVKSLSRRMLAIVCSIIFCGEPLLRAFAYIMGQDPEAHIYPISWFRFDGLALGALLALWIRSARCSRKSSLRMAGVMLALSMLILAAGAPFGVLGTKTLASTSLRYTHMQLLFGSGILGSLAMSGSAATAVLRTSFMRISADLSYCVYLIHVSVGDGYRWILEHSGKELATAMGPRGVFISTFTVIVVVSFGLAAVSKKYIENPFLRLKKVYF